jgi:hypothetical protein
MVLILVAPHLVWRITAMLERGDKLRRLMNPLGPRRYGTSHSFAIRARSAGGEVVVGSRRSGAPCRRVDMLCTDFTGADRAG